MINRVQALLLKYRLPLILALNLFSASFGYLLALGLRFDFVPGEIFSFHRLWFPLSILLLCRAAAYVFWGLNRGYWRYASTHDLVTIVKAHSFSSLLFIAAVGFLRISEFPRSVIFIEFTLSILLSGGARLWVRLMCETYLSRSAAETNGTAKEVIVLGAGDSGHLLVKYLQSQKRIPYYPVAVLDDSRRLIDTSVHGVRVEGPLSSLERCLEEHPRVGAVLVAIPSLSKPRFKEIEQLCKHMGVPLKRLQTFENIACSDEVELSSRISIESVLEKETQIEHEQEIREAISGKRVLVTGAGGSIGSELVRQILPFGPSSLILFDHSEFNLYTVEREFASNGSAKIIKCVLGSIINYGRLKSVFEETRPQMVFHAAAYKHVPLIEDNCYEAFVNNVVGTRNVLQACRESGVEQFVLISTDKAVDPSSVMGASKRLAEILVAEYSTSNSNGSSRESGLHTGVVRFGNVINSAGSVIPLFKKQIASGGPVTVTHPEMERYFMSIREAVRLVLTAGTLGAGGKIYVLDMGRPIKIVDVARKMLALYGMRDIPIVFTGMRPGEKLTEELTSSCETITQTRFAKVSEIHGPLTAHGLNAVEWISGIQEGLRLLPNDEIGKLMREFVELVEARRREDQVLQSSIESERQVGNLGY